MERRRSATLANPDAVERSVQRIEGIEQRFGLGFPAFAPQALGHSVQGLDRTLDVCSGCGLLGDRLFLGHSETLLYDWRLAF
jgi:hypothetical protein